MKLSSVEQVKALLKEGKKLPLATKNYPSRGQTTIQDLYQTEIGKLFLKKASEQNHIECQIDVASGTLAEREYWAYRLAQKIELETPQLFLLDEYTTVQVWFDYPDGHIYKQSKGPMDLQTENVFNCALFDWLSGQIDRHDANYLYNYVGQKIIPIDSAHGFLKYDGSLPDYIHLFEIGNKLKLNKKIHSQTLNKINSLTKQDLEQLVPLRKEEEKEALLVRKERLDKISSIQDLIGLYRG